MSDEITEAVDVNGIPPVQDVALDDSEPGLAPPGEPEAEAAPETPETPEEAPETPPADDPMAAAQAELERKDRELLIRQSAVKAQEDKLRQHDQLMQMARTDPGAVLKLLNLDPMTAAELALSGEKPAGPTAEERLAALEKRNQDKAQAEQEASDVASVTAEKHRLGALIQESKEQFPTLAQWGAKGAERLHGAILKKISPLVGAGIDLEAAVEQVMPQVPQIAAALETEVSGNVLTNIGSLLENKNLRDKLRAELDKADGAAPPTPGEVTPPPAAPSKGITNSMEGEHHATEEALTPEEADERGLDILSKAIEAGTL